MKRTSIEYSTSAETKKFRNLKDIDERLQFGEQRLVRILVKVSNQDFTHNSLLGRIHKGRKKMRKVN